MLRLITTTLVHIQRTGFLRIELNSRIPTAPTPPFAPDGCDEQSELRQVSRESHPPGNQCHMRSHRNPQPPSRNACQLPCRLISITFASELYRVRSKLTLTRSISEGRNSEWPGLKASGGCQSPDVAVKTRRIRALTYPARQSDSLSPRHWAQGEWGRSMVGFYVVLSKPTLRIWP